LLFNVGYCQLILRRNACMSEQFINQTPTFLYPIALCHLQGVRVVVVGGGPVGERKIMGLLPAGAQITLISPTATPPLQTLAQQGDIIWHARPFETADAAGAFLLYAATNNRAVNQAIAQAGQAAGVLCNVADRPEEGNFFTPAVLRHNDVVVAVNTTVRNPRRAVQVRDEVAKCLQLL
jgi:cobalt-precorrin 5A hydrolase/precorrin-3B C17-methyltransferase